MCRCSKFKVIILNCFRFKAKYIQRKRFLIKCVMNWKITTNLRGGHVFTYYFWINKTKTIFHNFWNNKFQVAILLFLFQEQRSYCFDRFKITLQTLKFTSSSFNCRNDDVDRKCNGILLVLHVCAPSQKSVAKIWQQEN